MISVCMTTYNGAKYVQNQIETILVQLEEGDELIISDDGSTDGTLGIIESFTDDRVKLVHHVPDTSFSGHEKVTANYESALRIARGDVIFLSDQDDIWLENKVARCVVALRNADLVLHNMRVMDDDSSELTVMFKRNPVPCCWLLNLYRMRFWGCAMAFRRELLGVALPFPYRLIGHDYWLSTIALRFFSVAYIDEPLMVYRSHPGSVTYRKRNKIGFQIKYRLDLMMHVLRAKKSD